MFCKLISISFGELCPVRGYSSVPGLWCINILVYWVVLIRSHDGYLDFLGGSPLIPPPVALGTLSLFFALFLVTILGPFLDPAGTPKLTRNATFGEKSGRWNGCFIDFSAFCVFSGFVMGFWAQNVAKIDEMLNVFFGPQRVFSKAAKAKFYAQA